MFKLNLQKSLHLYSLIRQHPGFFDPIYYRRSTSRHDLVGKMLPFLHYIFFGHLVGRIPNEIFDQRYYSNSYYLRLDEDPVEHYLRVGWKKKNNPHPLFDADFYLERYADVGNSGEEPLSHYLRSGWKLGYNPHPLFDSAHYLHAYQDVAAQKIDPFRHYISSGASEARRPNAIFKPDHYILSRPSDDLTLETALIHFDTHAAPELRKLYVDGERLRLRGPVGRVDDYALITGQRLINIKTDLHHCWKSPHVINREKPIYEIHSTLPKQYVAVLNNVVAFPGSRLLVTEDVHILHDELALPRAQDYQDKLKAVGNFDAGLCNISAIKFKDGLDKALIISSDTDFNYFHLMIETLPKLGLAETAGCPRDVPILMQGDLHPNLVTALETAAGDRDIIYAPWGAALQIREAWYVSDLSRVLSTNNESVDESYDIAISTDAVRSVSAKILKGPPRRGQRKIFMSRNSHYRHLNNQAAFLDVLKDRGFEIIDTGRMNLDSQIRAMNEADLIIAPTGAALTNLLWCPRGAKVLVLVADHPQMNLNIFNQVGEPLGINVEFCLGDRLHQMDGKYSVHDNFEIDLNQIAKWCDLHGVYKGEEV